MRMVLLRHDLPDGSGHFDWMIERPTGEALVTFRVGERIDQPGVAIFEAVRLEDHRAEYLTYQGEISGGRGKVLRVAAGVAEEFSEDPKNGVTIRGSMGKARGVWNGRREGPVWRFSFEEADRV